VAFILCLKAREFCLIYIKDIPNEVVDVDESGHYDPKKSPAFDQWMREG